MADTKKTNVRTEDPFDLVYSARLKKGKTSKFSADRLPWDAVSFVPFEKKQAEDRERRRRKNKLHPELRRRARKAKRGERIEVVITFQDELIIPRFPEANTDEARNSAYNKRALREASSLVDQVAERRAGRYRQFARELKRDNLKVLETYWLISGMLVDMPLSRASKLAERDDVVYLEPRLTSEKPPQNTNPDDDVDDGRRRIVSDPYFNVGLPSGWIGLLDTGVRFSHVLFNSPSRIAFRRDCVAGNSVCVGGDPTDDCWNHGTSTAAIISGNSRLGNAFRGVTEITIDSFKIYPNGCGGLDRNAVVRAFQVAVSVLDRVIVAEIQGSGDDLSAISTAADNAFNAGAVVIAANGNNGPNSSTVNTPANAHRVIGVGNFDVETLNQINSQSRGPAPDGRFKPDIQAPTNTETAGSASDTALKRFGGTSGATPYAAGAAALLRNWLKGTSGTIDPGQVYAQLILSGTQPYPFNNTTGAGPLRLPTDGLAWWGKVSVADGATVDIPIDVPRTGSPNTLDGALWWPEWAIRIPFLDRIEIHNDIDLYLIDPAGNIRDSSISIPSVFERVRKSGRVAAGRWKLRIRGYRVSGAQTVYWASHVRSS